jgi:hypothetical protein
MVLIFSCMRGLGVDASIRCCLMECEKLLTANLRNHTEKHSTISCQNEGQILSGSFSSMSPG